LRTTDERRGGTVSPKKQTDPTRSGGHGAQIARSRAATATQIGIAVRWRLVGWRDTG
jgi:hypothetical protein